MMVKNGMSMTVEQADSLKGAIDRFSWNYVRLRPHAETYLTGDAAWAINIGASSFADLIWNYKWSKRFDGYYELSGTIVWEQNSANGWMGNYAYDYLQKIMQGISAQKLIQSFDYAQVMMDAAARTVPFYKYTDNPARDAGPLRELIELGFEMSRVGATNPVGTATEPSAWLEAVMEGNAKLAGEGLSQFVAPFDKPNNVLFNGDRYGDICRSAFDYAQRLVQVAGAVDDPLLDVQVLETDVLSELVNLGGAYSRLNPMPYGNINFFLDTALNSSPNKASNDLEMFLTHYSKLNVKEILVVSNNVLKVISDIPSTYVQNKMRDTQILENWMDDILNYASVKKSLGVEEYIFDPTGFYEDILQARLINSFLMVARRLYAYSVSSPVLIASTSNPVLVAQDSVWDDLGGGMWGLFSSVVGGGIYLVTDSFGKIIRFGVSEDENSQEAQENNAVGKLLVGAIPTDKNRRHLKPGEKFKENERVENYEKPGGDRGDQIQEIEQVAKDTNQEMDIVSTDNGNVFVVDLPRSSRTVSAYPLSRSGEVPTTSIKVKGSNSDKVIKIRYTKGVF